MPEDNKLPVPEHLQYIVDPTQTEETSQTQDQSQSETQSEETTQPPSATETQTQILEELKAQGQRFETLQQDVVQMQEANASGRQYISELEQRGTAAPTQQGVDIESMTQQELVQYMNQQHAQQTTQQMQNMASQFGEMMELAVPNATMWKPEQRKAMHTLMSQGLTPKQANAIIQGQAAQAEPPAGNKTDFDTAVEKRANELLAQNRSSNAGISGKPARNDTTAPKLTGRELHAKLWHEHVVLGKPVPANTPG